MKTWLMASVFLMLAAPQTPQAPPRDTRAPAGVEAGRERILRGAIASGRASEAEYAELADLTRARGDAERADDVVLASRNAFPKSVAAQVAAASVFNRRGDFENAITALKAAAALQPESAEAQHRIAVFFWDWTRADTKLDSATRSSFITHGLDAENQALALKPDYLEAMTYKNILLRLQATLSTDPAEKARLISEADELRHRVVATQRGQPLVNQPVSSGTAAATAFQGFAEPFDQAMTRLTPVRVGGNIRVPTKIKDVRPQYPPEAQRLRVQGVVILEAIVDDTGAIANARVLRSIPLLDAAALEAVSQWIFTPSELNGRAVPVLMTVTVNFALQ